MWIKPLSVFGLGMVGLWEGIPAGFALRLPALEVGALSGAGSLSATLLVLGLGDRVRAWLIRPRQKSKSSLPPEEGPPRRERMIERVWRRYGVIGLGLLAPVLTGAPLGVALGLFLRAPPLRLLFWATVGIVFWTVALTIAGSLGIAGVAKMVAVH